MNLNFKIEIDFTTFDNLMEEDVNVVLELSCLVSSIKTKLLGIWIIFFLLKKYEKKMFSLMLDPRF
jgi:hypothetical protein